MKTNCQLFGWHGIASEIKYTQSWKTGLLDGVEQGTSILSLKLRCDKKDALVHNPITLKPVSQEHFIYVSIRAALRCFMDRMMKWPDILFEYWIITQTPIESSYNLSHSLAESFISIEYTVLHISPLVFPSFLSRSKDKEMDKSLHGCDWM